MNRNNQKATVARNRTRMQGAGSMVCRVTSTKALGLGTTSPSGIHRFQAVLDPMNGNTVNPSVTGLAGAYEFYRILSAKVEVVPTGGSQIQGSIQTAFCTNPELMTSWELGGDATKDSIILREQNTQTRALCQSYTHVMSQGRVTSRKWYSCNVTVAATTDDFDRSVAGSFLIRGVYSPGVQIPCTLVFTITYEFSGLGNTGGLTLLSTSGMDPFPVHYTGEADDAPPKQIELRRRGGEPLLYNMVAKPKPPAE